jgi:hypothetical protein
LKPAVEAERRLIAWWVPSHILSSGAPFILMGNWQSVLARGSASRIAAEVEIGSVTEV